MRLSAQKTEPVRGRSRAVPVSTVVIGSLFCVGAWSPAWADRIWRGVDLSYVNEMQDCGAVFRLDGEVRDPYEIFAEKGANVVRLRLWHSPRWTDYSTLPDVTRSIRRARALDQRVLLALHYSDDWSTARRQAVPAAWRQAGTTAELVRAVYDYTFGVLSSLNAQGLAPDYVQVGNAVNSGILLPDAMSGVDPIDWKRNAELLNAGIGAVRDAAPPGQAGPRLMLHVAQPENVEGWLAAATAAGLADFDIIGFSYDSARSRVPLSLVEYTVARLRHRYAKDVVIAETAYPWTLLGNDSANNLAGRRALATGYPASTDGQRRYLIDLMQAVLNGGGLGLVYWEPAWITTACRTRWGVGSHAENRALFDYERSELHEGADFLGHDYVAGDEAHTNR